MKIKLTSINGELLNAASDFDPKKMDAKMEVRYQRTKEGEVEISYLITVGTTSAPTYVVGLVYLILGYTHPGDENTLVSEAVDELQGRIELLLGLLNEEMAHGYKQVS